MKKLMIVCLLFLCGCGWIDAILGIDEKGNDLPGEPPISIFNKTIQNMGPIGTAITGLLSIAGGIYVGHKKGSQKGNTRADYAEEVLSGVVGGIQKVKDDMSTEDKDELVVELKKKIPNKYHPFIKVIKDAL